MSQPLMLYPVRPLTVAKFFGYPVMALGAAALAPLTASLFFGEWSITPYYLGISLFSLLLGLGMCKMKNSSGIRFNEAVVIVCLSYLYAAFIASIPLAQSGLTWGDALFEAISGITTTGLSMITNWQGTPKTTFFARAWLQWTGGLGIMIFSLALLINQGEITKRLSSLESKPDDVVGGSKAYARGIILIYSLLTGIGILLMMMTGIGMYESILYTFSSVSTGGFSHLGDSIASLNLLQQTILLALAFLCAISLPFYYKLWHYGPIMTLQGVQFTGLLLFSVLLAYFLGNTANSWVLAFSSQTTTGFSASDLQNLSQAQKLLVTFSMLIGGGVGSTAGGFKLLRLFLLIVFLRTLIIRQSQPRHAFYKPSFFGSIIRSKQFRYALALISLFFIATACSWLCFVAMDYDPIDSLFEVASALGTVGLSTGITSSSLPAFLKGVLCVNMLLGRVEVIPWLIFLYPKTWFGEQLEG